MMKKFKKFKIINNIINKTDSEAMNELENNEIDAIHKNIDANKKSLQKRFHNSIDLNISESQTDGGLKFLVVFFGELVKSEVLDRDVIKPLIKESGHVNSIEGIEPHNIKKFFPVSGVMEIHNMTETVDRIINGYAVFLLRIVVQPMQYLVEAGKKEL